MLVPAFAGKGVAVEERENPTLVEASDPALAELFAPTHVIPELKATTR